MEQSTSIEMSVDMVIPVKRINDYILESVPIMLDLDYENFSILIFPDEVDKEKELAPLMEKIKDPEKQKKVQIIETGHMGPANKRDLALKHSDSEILAFLDDDAYPRADWLKRAIVHFSNKDVAAVGGPAITPDDDTFLQKVSGAVFLSTFSGGNPERYWPIGSVREVDDWPSVNLLVRRDIFSAVGGFDSEFWPGEDTKLCLDIVKLGKKILYDPNVIVWHHRREGLKHHLGQIAGYGLHRGHFARIYPETSRRLKYFIPTLFVIFLFGGLILHILKSPTINFLYYTGLSAYLGALATAFYQIHKKEKKATISLLSVWYIFLTHIWYGVNFFKGLFKKNLKSKLRA